MVARFHNNGQRPKMRPQKPAHRPLLMMSSLCVAVCFSWSTDVLPKVHTKLLDAVANDAVEYIEVSRVCAGNDEWRYLGLKRVQDEIRKGW